MSDLLDGLRAGAAQPIKRRVLPTAGQDHRCAICGGPAPNGFGVSLRRNQRGRWACDEHRAQVEAMG